MSMPLRIDELRLRVPGLTREQGRQLADAVAQRLVERQLSPPQPRLVPTLAVSLHTSGTASTDRLADQIVRAIRRRLK